jgi:hypothetical protein
VCNRSKISLSSYTTGRGRRDVRSGLGVAAISRLSDELEVVLLPELTTGETSMCEVSQTLVCGYKFIVRANVIVLEVPSELNLLASGLGPTLGPMPESWYEWFLDGLYRICEGSPLV